MEVVDPLGVWIDSSLSCGTPGEEFTDWYGELPTSSDLLTAAREDLEFSGRIHSGDVVLLVGYPDASPRLVGVQRDGLLVALASYVKQSNGGWLRDRLTLCG